MKTADFNYNLPPERIAQTPVTPRDGSRLLLLSRHTGEIRHALFTALLEYLQPGDMLLANNSRVMPARLYGQKVTGGKVELLLLAPVGPQQWRVLAGGRKLREGVSIQLQDQAGQPTEFEGMITAVLDGAQREVTFDHDITPHLERLGHTPLPPYIHEKVADPERYQTVFSRPLGSAAAPTAGLHFTPELLFALRDKGVQLDYCTLHVGLDTFQPVQAEQVQAHQIHREWAELSPATAQRINETKLAGGRLIAVGTTAVRVLETAALRSAGILGTLQQISAADADGRTDAFCPWRPVAAFSGETDLFIYPGYRFRVVDSMITNFHLPQSSLLLLVSAFAGREQILTAYETAVAEKYRFYSFGDAMLIHPD